VKGVPEGWAVKRIGDIVQIKRGRVISSKELIEGDIPVIGGGITYTNYHNKSNTKSPTITISASGANAGYVNLFYKDVWASDCSFIDVTTTKDIFYIYSLLYAMKNEIVNLQKGSAQPHVYANDVMNLTCFKPQRQLIDYFNTNVVPIHSEIGFLKEKNEKLKTNRERLLSRLMSGKIDVENLDIQFPDSMPEQSGAEELEENKK